MQLFSPNISLSQRMIQENQFASEGLGANSYKTFKMKCNAAILILFNFSCCFSLMSVSVYRFGLFCEQDATVCYTVYMECISLI